MSEPLEDLFERAAAAASKVPLEMRNAAFDHAILYFQEIQTQSTSSAKTQSRVARKASKSVAPKASKNTSGRGRPGARAALRELATGGFFATPRTLKDVQQHLKTKRGLKFAQTSLSGPLQKLLQEGVLDREKNSDDVYEYTEQ